MFIFRQNLFKLSRNKIDVVSNWMESQVSGVNASKDKWPNETWNRHR